MPYYNSQRSYGSGRYNGRYSTSRHNSSNRRSYSKSEQIAFDMGQRRKIVDSINKGTDSRVRDAYCKGYNGFQPQNKRKPLY